VMVSPSPNNPHPDSTNVAATIAPTTDLLLI
jgi:hypothetical protein